MLFDLYGLLMSVSAVLRGYLFAVRLIVVFFVFVCRCLHRKMSDKNAIKLAKQKFLLTFARGMRDKV